MKKKAVAFGTAVCIAAFTAAACSNGADEAPLVRYGDAGWDSSKFHNAVAMYIAETAFGFETEEVSGSTAITYGGLQTGDVEVYMEVWSDNLPTFPDDVESGRIVELGINYDDNIQGLYVPTYVIEGDEERGIEPMAPDLRTVADLADYADIFPDPDDSGRGRIYGAISGWEVDAIMRNKYEYYGLDEFYNYMDPGSDAALAAAIAGAYNRGEAIVAYYWEPAWLTGMLDLTILEDAPYDEALYESGAVEFPAVDIYVAANPDFVEEQPEYTEFLRNYYSTSELTNEALFYLEENDAEYDETAIWFLQEHDDLLDEWLEEDEAAAVRAALEQE